jgi:hypothetical protein
MIEKPLLVIPRSTDIKSMLDLDMLLAAPRAQRIGVIVILPRDVRPADVMTAAHAWPATLVRAGVSRLAVLLGVAAYVDARPLLRGCQYKLAERAIDATFFHEGHLESDEIRAFFEQRRPRRRVTTDALIKLSHRYALRRDARGATSARRLGEAAARLESDTVCTPVHNKLHSIAPEAGVQPAS